MQGSSITARLILNSTSFNQGINSAIKSVARLEKAIARLNGIKQRAGKAHEKNITQQYDVSPKTWATWSMLEKQMNAVNTTSKSMNVTATQSIGVWGRVTGALGGFKNTLTGIGGRIKSSINGLMGYNKQLGKTSTLLQGIREWGRMLVVGVLMQSIGKIAQAAKATLNARTQISQFGKQMKWSTKEVNRFNKEISKQQHVFRKVNMPEVGGQVMNIAKMYNLSSKEATKFIRTSAVFTSAMAQEGRSTREATLALKDYIDQGAGWTRRMSEIGVTRENLLATGKWKGDKNDIVGMIEALDSVMAAKKLDDTAMHVNNLEEAWAALTNTIGMWIADLVGFVSPAILGLVNLFFELQSALGKVWNSLPEWVQAGAVMSVVTSAALVLSVVIGVKLVTAFVTIIRSIVGSTAVMMGKVAADKVATISTWGLVVANQALMASLIVITAVIVGVYLVLNQLTAGMREYNNTLENGEDHVNSLKEASTAYKVQAQELTETKKRLAAQGKDTTKVEQQIAEAYRKSAELAQQAKQAEADLAKARQKRAIHEAQVLDVSRKYKQQNLDQLRKQGIITEENYQKQTNFNKSLDYGAKQDYASLQRLVRINKMGAMRTKLITEGSDAYSKAWQRDKKGVEAYSKAWQELGQAVYELNQAKDPLQLIFAWMKIVWLKGSIWIGEISKLISSFTHAIITNPLFDVVATGLLTLINPIWGIIFGLEKLGEAMGFWSGWGDMFQAVISNIGGALHHLWNIATTAWTVLNNIFSGEGFKGIENLETALANAGQGFWDWITGVGAGLGNLQTVLINTGKSFYNWIRDIAKGLNKAITGAIKGLTDGINNWVDSMTTGGGAEKFANYAKTMIEGFLEWIKKLPDLISQLLTTENLTGGTTTQENAREGGKSTGKTVGENIVISLLEAVGRLIWELPGILWTIFVELGPVLVQLVPTLLSVIGEIGAMILAYIGEMIWNGMVWVGQQIYISTIGWGASLLEGGKQTGKNLWTGFIEWVKKIPENVKTYLSNMIDNVKKFPSQAWTQASNMGTSFVRGLKSGIKGLVDAAVDEFEKIIDRVKKLPTDAYNAAVSFGSNLKKGILSALDRHSPGIIQREVLNEFDELLLGVKNRYGDASEAGTGFGAGMASAVENTIAGISDILPTLPPITQKADVVTNTGQAGTDFKTTGQEALGYATTIKTTATNTFNQLQGNVSGTFKQIGQNTKSAFTNMSTDTLKSMTNLRIGTVSQMGQVKNSWNNLHDSLVKSATDIRVRTGEQINKLQTNMGSFWRKINNPVLLLGGAGGYAGSPYKSPRTKIRIPRSSVGGYAGGRDSLNFSENKSFRILNGQLPSPPCDNPNDSGACYAGKWSFDWTPSIKKTFMNWKPNFPNMYGLLNVAQFENDDFPVRGNLTAFSNWIYDVIGKTAYSYYFNSKGGSLSSILNSGHFNCWDGAHIVMALADEWGLPSSLQRGYWGAIPHVWANVAGKQIDTTAIQKGHGFTSPRVSGSPPSSRGVTGSVGRALSNLRFSGSAGGVEGSDGVKVVNINMKGMFDGAVIQGGKEVAKEIADVVMDIIDSEFDVDPATGV